MVTSGWLSQIQFTRPLETCIHYSPPYYSKFQMSPSITHLAPCPWNLPVTSFADQAASPALANISMHGLNAPLPNTRRIRVATLPDQAAPSRPLLLGHRHGSKKQILSLPESPTR
jgi:hypothetical protein